MSRQSIHELKKKNLKPSLSARNKRLISKIINFGSNQPRGFIWRTRTSDVVDEQIRLYFLERYYVLRSILVYDDFLARQDNEQQRPRPFQATQPQEYRGYLPPVESPPQPEFPLPTPSQFPSPNPLVNNPYYQTAAVPDQTADQTPPPPPPSPSSPSAQFQTESTPAPITVSDVQAPDFVPQTQQPTTFPEEPAGFLVTNPPPVSNSEVLQSNLNDVFHPPHIHEMNVQCSKDMMTINVEFNKPYDGVIYSKVRQHYTIILTGSVLGFNASGVFSNYLREKGAKD